MHWCSWSKTDAFHQLPPSQLHLSHKIVHLPLHKPHLLFLGNPLLHKRKPPNLIQCLQVRLPYFLSIDFRINILPNLLINKDHLQKHFLMQNSKKKKENEHAKVECKSQNFQKKMPWGSRDEQEAKNRRKSTTVSPAAILQVETDEEKCAECFSSDLVKPNNVFSMSHVQGDFIPIAGIEWVICCLTTLQPW